MGQGRSKWRRASGASGTGRLSSVAVPHSPHSLILVVGPSGRLRLGILQP